MYAKMATSSTLNSTPPVKSTHLCVAHTRMCGKGGGTCVQIETSSTTKSIRPSKCIRLCLSVYSTRARTEREREGGREGGRERDLLCGARALAARSAKPVSPRQPLIFVGLIRMRGHISRTQTLPAPIRDRITDYYNSIQNWYRRTGIVLTTYALRLAIAIPSLMH